MDMSTMGTRRSLAAPSSGSRYLIACSAISLSIAAAGLFAGCVDVTSPDSAGNVERPVSSGGNEPYAPGNSSDNIQIGSVSSTSSGHDTSERPGPGSGGSTGGTGANGQVDPISDGQGDGNSGGGISDSHSGTAATSSSGGTGGTTGGDPGIPLTGNSIQIAAGPRRSDPERVAPDSDTTIITWKDSRGADRSMTLGAYLYQYDFSFDDNQQVVQRSATDDAWGHEGFGYVVSHNTQTGNSPLGKRNAPIRVQTTTFAGGHHALHRVELLYDRDLEGGGFGIRIPVVIEWLVATGRDHPVWSVTWKMGEAENPQGIDFDDYRMDVRGPYGSLNFDGAADRAAGDAVGGVAWGDAGFRFETIDAELTLQSRWTYDTPNSVNFTRCWTRTVNAEMGIVQTLAGDRQMGYSDRVVGRERGHSWSDAFAQRGDCGDFGDARNYVMPCISGWPFQLMNYDWAAAKPVDEPTGTKLIAWGSPYGWLGAARFDLFDYSAQADGRGDRSYATMIILGPKNRYDTASGVYDLPGDVMQSVQQVEALNAATLEVLEGSPVVSAPRGPAAMQSKPLVNGYNDTYAAFYLSADHGSARFRFTPAAGDRVNTPIFVIRNYSGGLPKITVNGAAISVNSGAADSGAFVSQNGADHELWITLNRMVGDAIEVVVQP